MTDRQTDKQTESIADNNDSQLGAEINKHKQLQKLASGNRQTHRKMQLKAPTTITNTTFNLYLNGHLFQTYPKLGQVRSTKLNLLENDGKMLLFNFTALKVLH